MARQLSPLLVNLVIVALLTAECSCGGNKKTGEQNGGSESPSKSPVKSFLGPDSSDLQLKQKSFLGPSTQATYTTDIKAFRQPAGHQAFGNFDSFENDPQFQELIEKQKKQFEDDYRKQLEAQGIKNAQIKTFTTQSPVITTGYTYQIGGAQSRAKQRGEQIDHMLNDVRMDLDGQGSSGSYVTGGKTNLYRYDNGGVKIPMTFLKDQDMKTNSREQMEKNFNKMLLDGKMGQSFNFEDESNQTTDKEVEDYFKANPGFMTSARKIDQGDFEHDFGNGQGKGRVYYQTYEGLPTDQGLQTRQMRMVIPGQTKYTVIPNLGASDVNEEYTKLEQPLSYEQRMEMNKKILGGLKPKVNLVPLEQEKQKNIGKEKESVPEFSEEERRAKNIQLLSGLNQKAKPNVSEKKRTPSQRMDQNKQILSKINEMENVIVKAGPAAKKVEVIAFINSLLEDYGLKAGSIYGSGYILFIRFVSQASEYLKAKDLNIELMEAIFDFATAFRQLIFSHTYDFVGSGVYYAYSLQQFNNYKQKLADLALKLSQLCDGEESDLPECALNKRVAALQNEYKPVIKGEIVYDRISHKIPLQKVDFLFQYGGQFDAKAATSYINTMDFYPDYIHFLKSMIDFSLDLPKGPEVQLAAKIQENYYTFIQFINLSRMRSGTKVTNFLSMKPDTYNEFLGSIETLIGYLSTCNHFDDMCDFLRENVSEKLQSVLDKFTNGLKDLNGAKVLYIDAKLNEEVEKLRNSGMELQRRRMHLPSDFGTVAGSQLPLKEIFLMEKADFDFFFPDSGIRTLLIRIYGHLNMISSIRQLDSRFLQWVFKFHSTIMEIIFQTQIKHGINGLEIEYPRDLIRTVNMQLKAFNDSPFSVPKYTSYNDLKADLKQLALAFKRLADEEESSGPIAIKEDEEEPNMSKNKDSKHPDGKKKRTDFEDEKPQQTTGGINPDLLKARRRGDDSARTMKTNVVGQGILRNILDKDRQEDISGSNLDKLPDFEKLNQGDQSGKKTVTKAKAKLGRTANEEKDLSPLDNGLEGDLEVEEVNRQNPRARMITGKGGPRNTGEEVEIEEETLRYDGELLSEPGLDQGTPNAKAKVITGRAGRLKGGEGEPQLEEDLDLPEQHGQPIIGNERIQGTDLQHKKQKSDAPQPGLISVVKDKLGGEHVDDSKISNAFNTVFQEAIKKPPTHDELGQYEESNEPEIGVTHKYIKGDAQIKGITSAQGNLPKIKTTIGDEEGPETGISLADFLRDRQNLDQLGDEKTLTRKKAVGKIHKIEDDEPEVISSPDGQQDLVNPQTIQGKDQQKVHKGQRKFSDSGFDGVDIEEGINELEQPIHKEQPSHPINEKELNLGEKIISGIPQVKEIIENQKDIGQPGITKEKHPQLSGHKKVGGSELEDKIAEGILNNLGKPNEHEEQIPGVGLNRNKQGKEKPGKHRDAFEGEPTDLVGDQSGALSDQLRDIEEPELTVSGKGIKHDGRRHSVIVTDGPEAFEGIPNGLEGQDKTTLINQKEHPQTNLIQSPNKSGLNVFTKAAKENPDKLLEALNIGDKIREQESEEDQIPDRQKNISGKEPGHRRKRSIEDEEAQPIIGGDQPIIGGDQPIIGGGHGAQVKKTRRRRILYLVEYMDCMNCQDQEFINYILSMKNTPISTEQKHYV